MIISRLRRVLMLPLLVLALLCAGRAPASEPLIQSVALTERGHDLLLNADVSLELNNALTDAVERGLPLYFTVDVEIRRPRWYWFDDVVLSSTQAWRIIYNPLTRQWRVYSGNLALPVGSLGEALSVVRHVRNWRVGDSQALGREITYRGSMRVRFDVQLSKAVNALGSSEWSLSTPWTDFDVRLGNEPPPQPAPPAAAPAAPAPPGPAAPGPFPQPVPPLPPIPQPPPAAPPGPGDASGAGLSLTPRPGGGGLGLSPPEAP